MSLLLLFGGEGEAIVYVASIEWSLEALETPWTVSVAYNGVSDWTVEAPETWTID